ncbi:MAG: hypothetical protein WKF87_06290 [Chryseolinea sp.]
MDPVRELLALTYFNNSIQQYLIAVAILVIGLLLINIFKRYLLRKLSQWVSKSETRIDDIVVRDVEKFGLPALSFLIFYWSLNSLDLSPKIERIVDVAIGVVSAFFVIRLISSTIQVVVSSYVRKQDNGERSHQIACA